MLHCGKTNMAAPMRHVTRCYHWVLSIDKFTVRVAKVTKPVVNYFNTSSCRNKTVLGIETSCDDTGAAVVDDEGRVLGEALNSQTKIHVELGGIIPPVARDLHNEHIAHVVQQALERANMVVQDVDAVAVTVKPGMALSLKVGLDHAKKLVRESGKPLIPIHHMEAHALTARMMHRIEFPYLVLLISGGHCLLAVARDVADFVLLGTGTDDAPGDAFDKTARQLKLKNLPQFSGVSGGVAIETLARQGDPTAFEFPHVLSKTPSCDFSFAGLKFHAKKTVLEEEKKQGIIGNNVLENAADICASFQYGVLRHLARRVQRGVLFCDLEGLLPSHNRTLVVSGGVGSNKFIRAGLQKVCDAYSLQLVCPPPHLCTDNGVMIAWNGVEKLMSGGDFSAKDPESVDFETKCPLGENLASRVQAAAIKLTRLKLL